MSNVSEAVEEDKHVARTEEMSDDDAESGDEVKSSNKRRSHSADADSSLDRLSLPSVSHSAFRSCYLLCI